MVVVIVLVLTGIFGQSFWKISLVEIVPASITNKITNKVLLTAFKMNIGGMIAYYIGLLMIVLASFQFFKTIVKSQKKLKPLLQCLSLFIIMPLFSAWLFFSFFKAHIGIVLFSFGLLMSLLVCKIIISSVTRVIISLFRCNCKSYIMSQFP